MAIVGGIVFHKHILVYFTLTFTVEFPSGVPRDLSSLINRSKETHRLLIVSSSWDVTKLRDGTERPLFSYIDSINLPKNEFILVLMHIHVYKHLLLYIFIYTKSLVWSFVFFANHRIDQLSQQLKHWVVHITLLFRGVRIPVPPEFQCIEYNFDVNKIQNIQLIVHYFACDLVRYSKGACTLVYEAKISGYSGFIEMFIKGRR